MTQNKICTYCKKPHTTLDSDVVCDAFIRKKNKVQAISLGELYRDISFDTSMVTKEKYLPLSERMRKSLKRQYKKSKR